MRGLSIGYAHNRRAQLALGQIELVFTFIASIFFFKEKTSPMEFFGILLVVAAILILVLLH